MVASISNASNNTSPLTKSKVSEIKPEDFLKIMLAELQQQDPFEPVTSKDLIAQVGQVKDIQSSMDLSTTLKDLAVSQKLSAAGTLLGKEITGLNSDGDKISGLVSSITREGNTIYLELDSGQRLEVGNVLTVNNPKTTSTATDTAVESLTQNNENNS